MVTGRKRITGRALGAVLRRAVTGWWNDNVPHLGAGLDVQRKRHAGVADHDLGPAARRPAARLLPAEEAGRDPERHNQPACEDERVHGILLQLPLPGHLDQDEFISLIDPAKDVDGLTPISAGLLAQGRPGLRPCTPSGIIELLVREEIQIAGRHAVVIGRSDIVGKPMAMLLLHRDATVTICHSATTNLPAITRQRSIASPLIRVAPEPRTNVPPAAPDSSSVTDASAFSAHSLKASWVTRRSASGASAGM